LAAFYFPVRQTQKNGEESARDCEKGCTALAAGVGLKEGKAHSLSPERYSGGGKMFVFVDEMREI